MSSASQQATIAQAPQLKGWSVHSTTRIATLWSNYGSIERVTLRPSDEHITSPDRLIIIKSVSPPQPSNDEANQGHVRKLLSYEVERWFYHHLSNRLPKEAKVAVSYPLSNGGDKGKPIYLVMEDLGVDFPYPAKGSLRLDDTNTVLYWLAHFHSTFWGIQKEQEIASHLVPPPLRYKSGSEMGVWEQGTYWYLDTRQEEYNKLGQDYDWVLEWVHKVDNAFKTEVQEYGTLLHGDVKAANVLFSRHPEDTTGTPQRCALYDFQYAGVGIVTRDIVCLFAKSVDSGLLALLEDEKSLLRVYHSELLRVIGSRKDGDPSFKPQDAQEYTFERLWIHWEMAIVDWYRFMAGWGIWGNEAWLARRAREIATNWKQNGFHVQ